MHINKAVAYLPYPPFCKLHCLRNKQLGGFCLTLSTASAVAGLPNVHFRLLDGISQIFFLAIISSASFKVAALSPS